MTETPAPERPSRHFIEVEIDRDLAEGQIGRAHV